MMRARRAHLPGLCPKTGKTDILSVETPVTDGLEVRRTVRNPRFGAAPKVSAIRLAPCRSQIAGQRLGSAPQILFRTRKEQSSRLPSRKTTKGFGSGTSGTHQRNSRRRAFVVKAHEP